MSKLKPLVINIVSNCGSVKDCLLYVKKIKKAEAEGREVIVKIDSSGATVAKWR